MSDEKRGRGRPRPDSTIARDDQVYDFLHRSGPSGRSAMSQAFGVNQNIIYLSLVRLRRDGRVTKVRDGKYHLWSTVSHL
jgi:hypothetical protein